MLSPQNLLLITALACAVMLFVLWSLVRSRIGGVREWVWANVLTIISLILHVLRGVGPDVLTLVLSNTLLAAAVSAILVGVRKFLHQKIPTAWLLTGLTMVTVGVIVFYYVKDWIAARIVIVSIFHSAVGFAIARSVFLVGRPWNTRYPSVFMQVAGILFGIGHAFRGYIYATGADVLVSIQQPTSWNILFLSIGVIVLPVLTLGATMMVHDRMMSEAEDAANSDFLTGAWSRRAFFSFAGKELARADRSGRALSLLVLDVDHFKTINDTHGHAVGDKVLVNLTSRVESVIRNVDYFARLGGEEFAVLLPETNREAAQVVAERLRAALDIPSRSTGYATDNISYTVSIGIAQWQHGESFSHLLQRADAALYKAKEAGRNTVMTADAESGSL